MAAPTKGTAAAKYAKMETKRTPFLNRARECAKLTIPSLLPPERHEGADAFETPHQSLGARGLRTLSSKLLLALYPPTGPNFRYQIDDIAVKKLTEDNGTRGEIEKALDMRARAVKTEQENTKFRPVVFEAVRQLVGAGNYLLYIPEDPKEFPRGFRVDSYVVLRDAAGTVVTIITKEKVAFGTLPPETQEAIMASSDKGSSITADDEFDIYTMVELNERGKYDTYQEVEGHVVPGTEGTYPKDTMPYIALRFTAMDGESYGRSFV